MSTPEPMNDQPTSALDTGARLLATQHAVEALIGTLPQGDERKKFLALLSSKRPKDANDAYTETVRRFYKAIGP